MDITPVFGTVIPGSSPGGWTEYMINLKDTVDNIVDYGYKGHFLCLFYFCLLYISLIF